MGFRWSINVFDGVFTVFLAGDSGASKFLNKLYVSFPITVKKMAVFFFSSLTSFAIKYCSTLSIYSVMLSAFKSKESFYPVKPFSTNSLFLTFQTFIPSPLPCYISSSITLYIKKLNNIWQESKKLNVPMGINAIINSFLNIFLW